MKLERLLTEITPLPWIARQNFIGIEAPARQLVAETHGEGQTLVHNAAYLTLAANILPEMIAALEKCEDVIGGARLQGILSNNAFSPVNAALIAARTALDKTREVA